MEVAYDEDGGRFMLVLSVGLSAMSQLSAMIDSLEARYKDTPTPEIIAVEPYALWMFPKEYLAEKELKRSHGGVAAALIHLERDDLFFSRACPGYVCHRAKDGWVYLVHNNALLMNAGYYESSVASYWRVVTAFSAKGALSSFLLKQKCGSELLPTEIMSKEMENQFDEHVREGRLNWVKPIHDICGRMQPLHAVNQTFVTTYPLCGYKVNNGSDLQFRKGGSSVIEGLMRVACKRYGKKPIGPPRSVEDVMSMYSVRNRLFTATKQSVESHVKDLRTYVDSVGKSFDYIGQRWTVLGHYDGENPRQGKLFVVKDGEGSYGCATQGLVDRMLYGAKLSDMVDWHPVKVTYGEIVGQCKMVYSDYVSHLFLKHEPCKEGERLMLKYHDGDLKVAFYVGIRSYKNKVSWHLESEMRWTEWEEKQLEQEMLDSLREVLEEQEKEQERELAQQLDLLVALYGLE